VSLTTINLRFGRGHRRWPWGHRRPIRRTSGYVDRQWVTMSPSPHVLGPSFTSIMFLPPWALGYGPIADSLIPRAPRVPSTASWCSSSNLLGWRRLATPSARSRRARPCVRVADCRVAGPGGRLVRHDAPWPSHSRRGSDEEQGAAQRGARATLSYGRVLVDVDPVCSWPCSPSTQASRAGNIPSDQRGRASTGTCDSPAWARIAPALIAGAATLVWPAPWPRRGLRCGPLGRRSFARRPAPCTNSASRCAIASASPGSSPLRPLPLGLHRSISEPWSCHAPGVPLAAALGLPVGSARGSMGWGSRRSSPGTDPEGHAMSRRCRRPANQPLGTGRYCRSFVHLATPFGSLPGLT